MLMFCTPPATMRSAVPLSTAWAAKCTACWDEPHCRSTVTPGTASGRPAASQAVRAMSPACGPTVSTQPNTTSSTSAGSAWARSSTRRDDVRAQVGRVRGGEAAAAAGDRRADGFDDVGLGHRRLPRVECIARTRSTLGERMRIAYTPEQEELRRELRAYFAGLMTPEVRAALARRGRRATTGTATPTGRSSGSSVRTAGWR